MNAASRFPLASPVPQVPRRASLVAQTVSVLREEIQGRRWQGWLPGEHQLCGQLHVSRVTLRAALKQLEQRGFIRASQGRRRRIVAARRGKRSPSGERRVILVTPEPLQSLPAFTMFWVDGLREQLSDVGFHLEVHVSRALYGGRGSQGLKALTETTHPAVWILYRSTYSMQRWFSKQRLPCVITGSRHPGVGLPSLDRDYRATCRHAAGELLARGYRRLVLLNPETGTGGERESEEGFYEAAEQTSVPGFEASVVRHNGTVAGICARLDALFRRHSAPDALLVSRPAHVLTVLGHLGRRGIKVPQEVALISRDDDSYLEHVVPAVARYYSDPSAFAKKLSKLVLEIAAGGHLARVDHRIMPQLVRGETLRQLVVK